MGGELSLLATFVKTLGAPGLMLVCIAAPSLVMIFMYMDHRRYERERLAAEKEKSEDRTRHIEERARAEAEHKEMITRIEAQFTAIINQQEKRFEEVVTNYQNNVILVENYQRIANELISTINMATQVQTKLVEKIDNNMFCPVVKNGAGK